MAVLAAAWQDHFVPATPCQRGAKNLTLQIKRISSFLSSHVTYGNGLCMLCQYPAVQHALRLYGHQVRLGSICCSVVASAPAWRTEALLACSMFVLKDGSTSDHLQNAGAMGFRFPVLRYQPSSAPSNLPTAAPQLLWARQQTTKTQQAIAVFLPQDRPLK
jgi:hypothetical protein